MLNSLNYICNSQESKLLDKTALEDFSLPGLVLMENAAQNIAHKLFNFCPNFNKEAKNILILIGLGQNGGDGWALARILNNQNHNITVYFIKDANKEPQGEALINYKICQNLNIKIIEAHKTKLSNAVLKNSHLIIDAVFGTGLNRPLNENINNIFKYIKENKISQTKILAVDLPSGLCANSGNFLGEILPADLCVSLGTYKQGFFLNKGPQSYKTLKVADIGLPNKVFELVRPNGYFLNKNYIKTLIPIRQENAHKNKFGHPLIIGGAKGKTGALSLAALGAHKGAAGLVTVALLESVENKFNLAESLQIILNDNKSGFFQAEMVPEILNNLSDINTIAIGPGLGLNNETKSFLLKLIENINLPLVLDADALTLIKDDLNILKNYSQEIVLTPHPGEAARLLGCLKAEVENNRLKAAQEIAQLTNAVVILKGQYTVVANSKEFFINPTGGPYLAAGGSGDLLTGLISALIAQKMPSLKACQLAVYLHGYAADLAAQKIGDRGLLISEMAQFLPKAFAL